MKKTGRKIALFIILIAGLITLGSSMVSTYNDEYKLVLQFGKVVRVIDTPGLSFKVPFIQTTQSIPNYEMVYDLVPSEVNTRDKGDAHRFLCLMERDGSPGVSVPSGSQ